MKIPQELLKRIYEIEIIVKKKISDVNSGAHRSIFFGEGFDFEEYREYSAGDDVKKIDWHLLARIPDKVYRRCYREDKQLTIWILADLSGSLRFGYKDLTKKELLVKSVAYLGFSAAHELDKIGLIAFTNKIEKVLIPKSGKDWVYYMLNKIWDSAYSGNTDIVSALRKAKNYLRGSVMVFLLSDFLDENCSNSNSAFWDEIKTLVGSHDLIPVVFDEDPNFLLDARGNVRLKDLESKREYTFQLSKKNREKFVERIQERHSILRNQFIKAGTRAIFIKGEADFDKFLKFFLIRKKRRG